MANLISADEIMFDAFEPKMKARYIMYIEGIPSMLLKKAARPKITFQDVTLDHINVNRKIKGKGVVTEVIVDDPGNGFTPPKGGGSKKSGGTTDFHGIKVPKSSGGNFL